MHFPTGQITLLTVQHIRSYYHPKNYCPLHTDFLKRTWQQTSIFFWVVDKGLGTKKSSELSNKPKRWTRTAAVPSAGNLLQSHISVSLTSSKPVQAYWLICKYIILLPDITGLLQDYHNKRNWREIIWKPALNKKLITPT